MSSRQPGDLDAPRLPTEVQELLSQLETLNQPEDISPCIHLLKRVLTLVSRTDYPTLWAELHVELGDALQRNRMGDRRVQLRRSIGCYDTALTVYTREEMPADWARLQYTRGVTLHELAGLLTGSEREKILRDAITCFEEILTIGVHQLGPANRMLAQTNKGAFLRELAGMLTGSERAKALQEALACLNEVLQHEEYREIAPIIWAAAQSNKGSTLRDLAELLTDPEQQLAMVHDAIACYDASLSVYTHIEASTDWAAAQNNKGAALSYLSPLISSEKRREKLEEAITCYDAALTVYTHEVALTTWTTTQYNKGIALYNLSRWLVGIERKEKLQAALACFNAVLLERHHKQIPVDWARVQQNKGQVLCDLATLLIDTERAKALQGAIACFDEALLHCSSEDVADDWARTQNNKGNALRDLAGLLRGPGRAAALRAALVCFDAVLQMRPRKEAPTSWAMTQNNKSAALRDMAALLGVVGTEQAKMLRVKLLRAAIVCCNEALTIYTREEESSNWSAVQNNKGNALRELAEALTVPEQKVVLQAALACYNAALLEQSREISPVRWAMIQNNKGMALRDLAGIAEGDERGARLQEVMVCYDAVLSVYTRQVLPADHHRIAQSIGLLLFKEGDWKNAARYLATALDALNDVFTLEITSHGRKVTLKAGGDLAAHLAYALLRTGEVDAAWRAAEALEHGRARATGEAMARQEAQLAFASLLAPELLEHFREASDRLVQISLGSETLEAAQTALSPDKMSVVGEAAEHTALTMLNMQLTGYEEARAARQAYDDIVAQVRSILPDFLQEDEVLGTVVQTLAPDERLGYIAHTPVGAMAILFSHADKGGGAPHLTHWWDERLTSTEVARLLSGPSTEGTEQPGEYVGLLPAQSHSRALQGALRVVMQTLGKRGGVVAHLAAHCRAAGIRRLVLVPCGLLGLLPLHAALVPPAIAGDAPEPLLDVVRVSYTPSVRIWAGCQRRAKGYSAQIPTALLVSDPQPQDPKVRPLSGAQVEAEAINEIISNKASGHVFAYDGREARLPVILDTLQSQAVTLTHVHFACHGLVELSDPYTAGLLLAYGSRLMTRDLLDPAVVRFERLRLAVLSACRTALPGTELPDEVIGLPSGWLQAGGIGVLASLWTISDSKTVALMTKFYELHLLDELDPVEALWLAQRWFRQLPTWRQDCQAAGALHAAEGPEASEVVHELEVTRGETMPVEDETTLSSEAETEIIQQAGEHVRTIEALGGNDAHRATPPGDQQAFWEQARHWAAFVMYGA